MKFHTPRWGDIEVDEEKILCFAEGLPGFPDCSRFIVMDHDTETPLKWLQCVDRAELALLIVEPEQIMARYSLEVPTSVLNLLDFDSEQDERNVAVFVILNAEDGEVTANLRAPVVVNVRTRRAFQMIVDDQTTPLRHPVLADREAG